MKKSLEQKSRRQKKLKKKKDCDIFLNAILNSPDTIISSIDKNYNYTSFSQRYADVMKALYGIDIEIDKNLLDYHSNPLDRSKAKANLDRALAGELVKDSAYAGEDTKTRLFFDVTYIPLRDASGQITGVLTIAHEVPELNRSEQVLRMSMTKLKEVQNRADIGDWEYNIKSGKSVWSIETFRLFGRPVGSEAPSFWERAHLVHPYDRPRFLKAIQNALENGTPYDIEIRSTLPDGSLKYFHEIGQPIYEKGKIIKLSGTVQDITERKKIESVLKESEEKFRAVVEHIPDLILVHRDGIILYINPAAIRVIGYTPEEMLNKPVTDFIPREYHERVARAVAERMKGKHVEPYEIEVLTKSGSRLTAVISGQRINFAGAPASLVVLSDITEQKRIEEALRGSEEQYRTLAEAARDMIFVIDRDDRVTYVNSFAARLFGAAPVNIIGKYRKELFPQDVSRKQEFDLNLIFENGEPRRSIGTLSVDGKTSWFDHYLVPITDKSGRVISVLGISRNITDFKNAQDALQESEAHLNSILQALPVPQFVIDRDHRVISWNKALEEYSGIKAKDIVGTSQQWKAFYNKERPCLADILVNEALEKLPEWYEGKINKSKLVDEAYEATDFFPKMGKAGVWLYFTAAPVRDTKGNIIGAVETLEDITDQKIAEETLKKSEEKFRTVVEYVPDLILVHRNGIILFINPASAQVIGYTSNEILNKPITDFISPEYHERVAAAIRKRMKGEHVEPYEIEILTKSRGRRAVTVRGTRIEFGGSPAILNVLTDITDRRQTEEALKKSEERYRNVVQSQTEFICRFLRDGTHIFVNEAYCNYFKKPCQEIMGHQFAPNIPFLDRQKVREFFASLTPDNPVATIEHRIIMPDGEVRWQQWIDRAIFDTNGRVTEYQSVGRDITKRKNMEEEIRSLNTILEQRVMERTAQLNASLKEKETLLREIHHRVKNNLQMIISLLHLQSASIKDKKTLNAIEDSEVRIKAMALVHEKLYQSENLEEIDIENYIRFLVKNLFSFYGTHAQNLNSNISIREVRVTINIAIPLGLIINEIVTNSLKYAFPDGRSGEILISGQLVNDSYEFIIGDNGIGMPPDLDWKNTESLGLKLVNMLVDQLDGTIERLPRQGTIFKIIIKKKE